MVFIQRFINNKLRSKCINNTLNKSILLIMVLLAVLLTLVHRILLLSVFLNIHKVSFFFLSSQSYFRFVVCTWTRVFIVTYLHGDHGVGLRTYIYCGKTILWCLSIKNQFGGLDFWGGPSPNALDKESIRIRTTCPR